MLYIPKNITGNVDSHTITITLWISIESLTCIGFAVLDLGEKIKLYGNSKISELHDVCVEFDCNKLNADNFQHLVNLSQIIEDSGEIGVSQLDIFKVYISKLDTYENELIRLWHTSYYIRKNQKKI